MHLSVKRLNPVNLTDYLRQRVAFQVQQDCSRLETCPELEQTVQGQRGHVGFTPPLSSFLDLLLELHPPEGSGRHREEERTVSNTDNCVHFSELGTLSLPVVPTAQ